MTSACWWASILLPDEFIRVIEESQKAFENDLHRSSFWQHTGFAKLMLVEVTKSIEKAAISQDHADEMRVACALERFRIANGKYPSALEELAPKLLDKVPIDVCDGQPLRYRSLQDGRFVLYGVGWNEKDDGGVTILNKEKAEVDPNQGDWVWPTYPAK